MVDAPSITPVETGPRRPWLAAILSFLFPGLGQAYAGQRNAALIFAAPMVAVVLVVALFVTGVLDPPRNILLSTGFLGTVLVLNAAILLWRSAAIAHAGRWPWRELEERERLWTGMTVGVLLAATLAMHVWVGVVVVQLEGALTDVFAGVDPGRRVVPPPSDASPTRGAGSLGAA